MRFNRTIFLMLSALFLLCCCSKLTHQPEAILLPEVSTSSTLILKSGSGLDPKEGELNPDYFVAEKDLQAYLKYKRLVKKNPELDCI